MPSKHECPKCLKKVDKVTWVESLGLSVCGKCRLKERRSANKQAAKEIVQGMVQAGSSSLKAPSYLDSLVTSQNAEGEFHVRTKNHALCVFVNSMVEGLLCAQSASNARKHT